MSIKSDDRINETLRRISALEAFELQKSGYLYLDVRSVVEFEEGHPEGAFNIPWSFLHPSRRGPNHDFIEQTKIVFSSDSRLIVGCRSGVRSRHACQALVRAGFDQMVEIRPGTRGISDEFGSVIEKGWFLENLPWSETPEPGHDFSSIETRFRATSPTR